MEDKDIGYIFGDKEAWGMVLLTLGVIGIIIILLLLILILWTFHP